MSGVDSCSFSPQLEYVAQLATTQGQEYLSGFYQTEVLTRVYGTPWVLGMRHLALPLAAALAALAWLAAASVRVLRRSTEASPLQWFTLSASLQMLLASAIWMLQESRHGTGLVLDFMTYPLIFPTFLVVSSGFARAFGSGRLSAVSSVLVAGAAGAPLVYSGWLQEAVGPRLLPSWPAVAPFLLYGGSLLAIALLGRHARTLGLRLVLVAVFGVGNAFSISQFNGLLSAEHVGLRVAPVHSHSRRDASLSVVDLHLRLSKAGLDRAYLWWDEGELIDPMDGSGRLRRLADIGMSTLRTGVHQFYASVTPGIDEIPADYLREFTDDKRLVALITRRQETVERMLARLREWGEWRLLGEEDVAHGGIRFRLFWLGSNSP